jgi:ABC-type lipoprotein export system ATPase subunit
MVKTYGSGDTAVHALRGVDMAVAKGEVVGLIGPSGSGKSTLLKCLGAVIEPTSGRMTIGDRDLRQWLESRRSARAAPRPDRLHLPGALPDPVSLM